MKAIFATDLSPASEAALDCLCACEAADMDEVVLLHVMGNVRRGGLRRRALGSTAEAVASAPRLRCPLGPSWKW